ncbi:NAD(P)-binding protein [Karstenula rhodostoma CBS 690.94]|uniref:NAD(P)-binding protein n=1 Tax=Karstenula rhodostoma CBS 690.94 TaxID=1392251 RepID=A0A9P4U7Q3_9PLEO|nr:NAD(P)-binding protein [Karstenula rhodostoma CBS 690.94]
MAPTYLITAANGHIGTRLVPLLLSHPSQPTLVLPTSNAARLTSSLPADVDKSRVHVLEGSINNDPAFVDAALKNHNVTAVFLCLTGSDELFTTFNFLDSMRKSSTVKHLVYLSAASDLSLEAQQSGILKDIYCAHVAVKFIVEAKIMRGLLPRDQEGGFSWTILGPTLFFGNDLMVQREMLEEGVFDAPLGSKGVSRVSEDDVALATVKALEDDGKQWGGKKIMIGSLQTYANQKTAQLWSQALGKEIKPILSDKASLDGFEQRFAKKASPAWGRDVRLMYELFEAMPFGITEEQYNEQVALLGKEADSYEKFVEDTGKQWKQ